MTEKEQPHEKLKDVRCSSRNCKAVICQSDGEFLHVGKLEILPKFTLEKSEPRTQRKVSVDCPHCGWTRSVYLRKTEPAKSGAVSRERKFLIFRSRF